MEDIQIVLMVAFGFTGLFALLLGYLIKENQMVEIISMPNFSIEKIKDKATFSRFSANRVYLIGWIALITAVMIAILPQFIIIIAMLFSLAVIAICIEFMITSKKHLYTSRL